MTHTAKLFANGHSQAVRLPQEYRFEGTQVYIRKDPGTGDVILSEHPSSWDGFFDLYDTTQIPEGFLTPEDRNQHDTPRDPFDTADETPA